MVQKKSQTPAPASADTSVEQDPPFISPLPKSEAKPKSINLCGLWLHTYKDSQGAEVAYLSGSLGHTRIAIFANANRQVKEHPTHHLVLSEKPPKSKEPAVEQDSFLSDTSVTEQPDTAT